MVLTESRDRVVADRAGAGGFLAERPGLVALVAWLVCLPVAWWTPTILHANPWAERGGGELPLALGGMGLLVLGGLGWWLKGRWLAALPGVAAGVFAAYVVLVLRTALNGTPYGVEATYGDAGRLMAAVTRYTVAWMPHDPIVGKVTSEYPPLFPWLSGKIAWLLGIPGWQALKHAEILGMSGVVLVSFWLWLRITVTPAALAISVLILLAGRGPDKVHEALALAVAIPWILLVVARPTRGRLHWVAAGLIGTALALTYYAYIVFAAIGLVFLIVSVYRAEPDRRAYLAYLGKVAAMIAVLAAWWWIPYAWAMLNGGQQVADMFKPNMGEDPFPFLQFNVEGVLEAAGLAGLLCYRTRTWWAPPLLLLVVGAYAFRALAMLRWVATAHSTLFYYTRPVIVGVLICGLVLSAFESAPLARRLSDWVSRSLPASSGQGSRLGVPVAVLLAAFTGYTLWASWSPATSWEATWEGGARAHGGNQQVWQSHAEPLPDGRHATYASHSPSKANWLPVPEIQQIVRQVRGTSATPSVLSADTRIFAFLPWDGYLDVDRDASLGPVQWDNRYAEVLRLTHISDPAAFAQASAHTAFGSIDVFILYRSADNADSLRWPPLRVPQTPTFQPGQFSPAQFAVMDLPNNLFLAVRLPS